MAGWGSTVSDVRGSARGAPSHRFRIFGVTLLCVIVAAGAIGVFGVHSRTATATGSKDGYRLSVVFPQTARAGLDVPWRAIVASSDGFTSAITIAVSTDYFRMFETQGFYPDPDEQTNDGRFVYFSFNKPRGHTFVLDYDAYIQPASQIGKSATVEVLVHNAVVARTTIHTWLVP